MGAGGVSWRNWAGNQSCEVRMLARPHSLEELAEIVRAVADRGGQLRVAGSGHSFTPLVTTDDTVLDLSALPAGVTVDARTATARISGHIPLSGVGPALWREGFAIANQGDVDVQTIAGAIATGTKGSGIEHGTMSSRVVGMTVLSPSGELVRIDGTDPQRLRAAQACLGLFGPVVDIALSVVPRYLLRESNAVMSTKQLLAGWDELKRTCRHFSFWWMPTAGSSAIYGLPPVPADHAYVKMLAAEPVDGDVELTGEVGERIGPAYQVYPDTEIGDPFYELEYVVAADQDVDAFLAMRDLMRNHHPDETTPLQVRWQAADDAFLSPQYRRDSVSLSVSGTAGTDYLPFLRAVHQHLRPLAARPHWGKIHFLDRQRVEDLYPELDAFRAVRRELDPGDVFLNHHLRDLLG